MVVETIINIGTSTTDPKTTLKAATTLAHITEVLNCNEHVACDDAVLFMIELLKDTKKVK